jgi:hypothetical protein
MQPHYRVTSTTHPDDLHEYTNPHSALKYAESLVEDGFEPQISVYSKGMWANISYDDMLRDFG